jgi:hypothetical protein
MSTDGVIGFAAFKAFEGRKLNEVGRGGVKRLAASVACIGLRGCEEGFRMLQPFGELLGLLGEGVVVAGQAFDLLGVEHRVGFQERDTLGVLLSRAGVGFGFLKAVGIDHGGPMFSLADVPACFLRLVESEPDRAGVAYLEGSQPQD